MPIHCQPLSFVFLKVETAYSMSNLAPKSSGSLAMFAAMRLASSHISTPAMSGLSREAGPLAGSSHKVLIYQRVISSPKSISPTPPNRVSGDFLFAPTEADAHSSLPLERRCAIQTHALSKRHQLMPTGR